MGALLDVELAGIEEVVGALVGVVLRGPLPHAATSAPAIVARAAALDHCLTVMLDLVSDARVIQQRHWFTRARPLDRCVGEPAGPDRIELVENGARQGLHVGVGLTRGPYGDQRLGRTD